MDIDLLMLCSLKLTIKVIMLTGKRVICEHRLFLIIKMLSLIMARLDLSSIT